MTSPVVLRVGTYNLQNGGLEGPFGDDARLLRQIDLLRGLELDVIGLQEAKWGEHGRSRLEDVADRLGLGWADLVPSNFHGCDLAIMVRETDRVKVARTRHLTGPPFVHAHGDVELMIADRPRPVRFMVGHAAPSSPTSRLAEAELVGVYRGLDVIYAADFNAAAIWETPHTTSTDPHHVVDPHRAGQKGDTRPAHELDFAGLIDIGAHMNDATPTVGHASADRLSYRCDRIHTTLDYEAITGYCVVTTADDLSDHRPVWAEFLLR